MSTSSSSSSSVDSFYTSNGTTRLNGTSLFSGIDTEKLITALTSKTQSKITKQEQLKQKAEWKEEMYQEVESLMDTLSDTYFSYSSDTNILSSTFFDSDSLNSSSSAVSATSSASDAGNVVIDSISQTATAAYVSSQKQVSDENITSGSLRTTWKRSIMGGQMIIVSYGGTDYTLSPSYSATLDDQASDADNLNTIASALNDQIKSTDGLNGKVEFSVSDDQKSLTLKSLSSTKTVGIKAYQANVHDTTGKAFLTALGFTSGSSGTTITGSATTLSAMYNHSVPSTSSLNIKVGSNTYTLKLGTDIDLSSCTTSGQTALAMATALTTAVNNNTDLKGKITVTGNADGTISFAAASGVTDPVSITGGSECLLAGLGLQTGTTINNSGTADISKLTLSYLGDTLAGSTVTFNLDGVSKAIAFDASDETSYSDPSSLASYLQNKINTAFGSNKINIAYDNNTQKLTFTASDSTSILTVSSSSTSYVLGNNGALRIPAGETNRVETTKTLSQLSSEIGGLKAGTDGKYTFTINGKSFSFDGATELGTVMTKINDDTTANVKITYNKTSNTFKIAADETGTQGSITMSDTSGNLISSLFGVDYSDVSAIKSADVSTLTTTGSSYTFQIGTNSSQTIDIAAGTYNSVSDLAKALQSSINSNSELNGKVIVGVDGSKITFNTSDNTSSASQLTVAYSSGDDILQIGSGKTTSIVDSSETLETLYNSDKVNGIISKTEGTTTTYSIDGGTTYYSGSTVLSSLGYNGNIEGSDLQMKVKLDGSSTETTITRSTNSFTLEGVTLNVSDTYNPTDSTTTSPIKFTNSTDVDTLYKNICSFIDAYNKVIDKANTYTSQMPAGLDSDAGTNTKYEPLTDDQKKTMSDDEITKWNEKAKQGLLQNDNVLNGILDDFSNIISGTVKSVGISLSDIGITMVGDVTKGGQLQIDETTFKNYAKSNQEKLSQLFTNGDGVSQQLQKKINKYIGTMGGDGMLLAVAGTASKTTTNTSQIGLEITGYEANIKELKTQLSDETSRWTTKFSAMESKLSVLDSQYNYLSSMLGTSSS